MTQPQEAGIDLRVKGATPITSHICHTEKSKPLSIITTTTTKKKKKKATFHSKTGGYKVKQDEIHQLPRHKQTTIFRLRTGHRKLKSHLKRIGIKNLAQWPCGEADQTPAIMLILQPSKAADMAHLCVPQNQALEVCRGFVPDIRVCGTHRREDLVNATITSNAEEDLRVCRSRGGGLTIRPPG